MWDLKNKNDTNELICSKQKQIHKHRKPMVTKRERKGRRGINEDFRINRYTLLHIKYKHNKALLYSTGTIFDIP